MFPVWQRQPHDLAVSSVVLVLLLVTLTLFWPTRLYAQAQATPAPVTPTADPPTNTTPATPEVAATAVVTAAASQPSAPLTVTISGGDDPAQVETFLRYLLAGYAPQNGYITATIGELPADFLLDLPLPEEAVVVGSYMRTGEYAENMLLIAAADSLDDVVDKLWQSLLAQGFHAPADGARPGQVFLSWNSPMPDLLCSPDDDFVLHHSRVVVQDAPPVLRLSVSPAPALYSPCSSTLGGTSPAAGILPQLLPPPGAQVQASGGAVATI